MALPLFLGYRLLHLPFYSFALMALAATLLLLGLLKKDWQLPKRYGFISAGMALVAAVLVLRAEPYHLVVALLSVLPVLVGMRGKPSFSVPFLLWAMNMGIWFILAVVPDHLSHRYANLEFSIERDTDYKSWHTYGEKLLGAGDTAAALEAFEEASKRAIFQGDTSWREAADSTQEVLGSAEK